MKTLFGMTAAVMMLVTLLFVSLPGTAGAAGKVRAEIQRAAGYGKPAPVTPSVNGEKAYCENNNIMRPDGSVFASCGDKICEENPYGAMCVPRVSPSSAQGLPWINPFK